MASVTEQDLQTVLAAWLARRVRDVSQSNGKDFSDKTGIKPADISNVINRKKNRTLTWTLLQRIAATKGPPLAEIVGQLADAIGVAEARIARRLPPVEEKDYPPLAGKRRTRTRLPSGRAIGVSSGQSAQPPVVRPATKPR